MVAFALGHGLGWLDVNDILVHLQGLSRHIWVLLVPDGRQLRKLKSIFEEALNRSIRNLILVFKVVDLRRVESVFYIVIVELLHLLDNLGFSSCTKLII